MCEKEIARNESSFEEKEYINLQNYPLGKLFLPRVRKLFTLPRKPKIRSNFFILEIQWKIRIQRIHR